MDKIQTNRQKPEMSFFENDSLNRIISFDTEMKLDSLIEDSYKFMSENDGSGLNDIQRDELYAKAQELCKSLQRELRESKLLFYFNRQQYNFITDLILKKLEYDVDTVFIAIDLKNLMFGFSKVEFAAKSKDIKFVEVTPTEITYVYHLIAKYKVKGLTDDAFRFSEILRRIGQISKIVSYYDTAAKNLVSDIGKWALEFDSKPGDDGSLSVDIPNGVEGAQLAS